MLDLPPLQQERIVCSITAAIKYQVPANILLAIAEKEGGRPGMVVANRNGTYDIGPMQFNSAYLRELRKHGIGPAHVTMKGCYSYDLAAWRLRQHLLHDKGNLWARAANYHSRSAQYNLPYRADLMRKGYKWALWLEYNRSFTALIVLNYDSGVSAMAMETHTVRQAHKMAKTTRNLPTNAENVNL